VSKKPTVYTWCQQDKIPHIRLPGCIRFRASDIEKWMNRKIEAEKKRRQKRRRPSRRCDSMIDRLIQEAKREVLS